MNGTAFRAIAISSVLLLGAGCVPARTARPVAAPVSIPAEQQFPEVADAYAGWGEIQPGGVVSLRIPAGCQGDPGAGNIYVTCGPDAGNGEKTVIHTSSDGIIVNIRRGTVTDWPEWDKVIASLHVLAPLGREVKINIEK